MDGAAAIGFGDRDHMASSGAMMAPWMLSAADAADLERYLQAEGMLPDSATPITVAHAGAGNMNLTLRVCAADGKTLIVKQGRPWVEKYAHIPAPFERTLVEAAFYRAVAPHREVAAAMPALLHVDEINHVLVLEDVGAEGDWTSVYAGDVLPSSILEQLLTWLEHLGNVRVDADQRRTFQNRAMRLLNHEHIFDLPLRAGNGLSLDAITVGLADAARELQADRRYCESVADAGQRYLADGGSLVHGDYFPGSWLRSSGGVRIIDPEFCFIGDPSFDYGVMGAHLLLAGSGIDVMGPIAAASTRRGVDPPAVLAYAGSEIMRRLIGVAQLPLGVGIDRKRSLLQLSRQLVLEPSAFLDTVRECR
jgi:5-methylthioribose kinase